jgi:hypothetical protein
MSKNRPVFRPISAPLDVPDEALNALGDRLGVPKMVKPEPPQPREIDAIPENPPSHGAPASFRATPSPARRNAPLSQNRALPFEVPQPASEKITVELPGYVTAAMRQRSAQERLSHRYYVLMGLRAIGFEVADQDLVPDGRRLRLRRDT